MGTYTITLLEKKEIAQDTYAFYFEKPLDFKYQAGQYISLCIDTPEIAGPGGTMRELSLASAPYEKELVLALRFRDSPAKQQFIKLNPGDTAYLQGPFGTFILDEGTNPVVFLAGGIGIVPILGMLKDALHEKQERQFSIFFTNRRKADVPFLTELEALAQNYKNTLFIRTLTAEMHPDWEHESGYLTPIMFSKYLQNPQKATYYISGSQGFVGGMWDVLEKMEISSKQIHGEEFTGY